MGSCIVHGRVATALCRQAATQAILRSVQRGSTFGEVGVCLQVLFSTAAYIG